MIAVTGTFPGMYGRLLAAPFLLSIVDMVVTLRCQPAEYWQGYGFDHLIEANPLVRVALAIHPFMLVPGFMGWYAIVFMLQFKTPAWIGLRVHATLVLGHLIAVAGGCLRFTENPGERILLLLLLALPPAAWLFLPFAGQWNSKTRLQPISR